MGAARRAPPPVAAAGVAVAVLAALAAARPPRHARPADGSPDAIAAAARRRAGPDRAASAPAVGVRRRAHAARGARAAPARAGASRPARPALRGIAGRDRAGAPTGTRGDRPCRRRRSSPHAERGATLDRVRAAAHAAGPGVAASPGFGAPDADFEHAVYGNFPLDVRRSSRLLTFLLLARAFRSVVLAAEGRRAEPALVSARLRRDRRSSGSRATARRPCWGDPGHRRDHRPGSR